MAYRYVSLSDRVGCDIAGLCCYLVYQPQAGRQLLLGLEILIISRNEAGVHICYDVCFNKMPISQLLGFLALERDARQKFK